jgi:hypothetical protein
MTCEIPAVVTDNELVYSSLSNAVIAAGESLASAAIAKAGEISAKASATTADASKVAAFSSETLAGEHAAIAVDKSIIVHNKAIESTNQRELAHKWASEDEAVWVSDGVNVPGFSAYHWAKQAQHQNSLTMGGIAQYIADGVADYITYNAIGNSLLNTALGTRIEQIDLIDARTKADALITLQEIVDRGTAITSERTLRLAGEERLAQETTTLSATMVSNIAAAVLVESTARATAFDANAMVVSLLTAQINDPETGLEKTRADILTEEEVKVTVDAAVASNMVTLTATFTTDISAAIQTEQTTRAAENTALANSVTTLQTTVGGNTTAIQTAQTSVDGINAKYTVKIDSNGYVTGFGLISEALDGTPKSAFAVRADAFSIASPAVPADESTGQLGIAAQTRVPFIVYTTTQTIDGVVINPGVYMDSACITRLNANQIDTRGLTVKDADGNVIFGSGTGVPPGLAEGQYMDYAGIGGATAPAANATRNAFAGVWQTDYDYVKGDIVTNGGNSWVCLVAHTSTTIILPISPATTNEYWALNSAKGTDGKAYLVIIESSNGLQFKVGKATETSTTLKAYVFLNGEEVTNIDASWFNWRRVSANPVDDPDSTWNEAHKAHASTITVTISDVFAKATFFCDIIVPTPIS